MVIAGAGVAGLEAMLALNRLAGSRVRVLLLAPERIFVHRPQALGPPFGSARAHRFDISRLAAGAGARFSPEAIRWVDPERHLVGCDGGARFRYDSLLVAVGATPRAAVSGGLTWWGRGAEDRLAGLLDDLCDDREAELVFVVPPGAGWSLPLYEMALQARRALSGSGANPRIRVVTCERAPAEVLGTSASARLQGLLRSRGIALRTGARGSDETALREAGAAGSARRRIVALPRLAPRRIDGLPGDEEGFLPLGSEGRVRGVVDVYAAGDAVASPVKQSGLAAEQADRAAEAIAVRAAGGPCLGRCSAPGLRGLLVCREGAGAAGPGLSPAGFGHERLWWPPGPLAGRYLSPHLSSISGSALWPRRPPARDTLEIELDAAALSAPAYMADPTTATHAEVESTI